MSSTAFSQPAETSNFLVISDIHLTRVSLHAMEINPTKKSMFNDLDESTFEKLMANVAQEAHDGRITRPDYIFILGDIFGHLRFAYNNTVEMEANVFKTVKRYFPNTPIFYVFGNNDSLKENYGPFKLHAYNGEYKSPYDISKQLAGWRNGFLSTGDLCSSTQNDYPCIINENTINGYYSAYLKPKLRLIALNSVLFSPNRFSSAKDARAELQWLADELKVASAEQESVLLAMHVPPGNNVYDNSAFWLHNEQSTFLNLINHYRSNLMGILASHTHAEELKMVQDESGKNITGIYLTAAFSTSHGNAPSVKSFAFSPKDGQWRLNDYETYNFSVQNGELLFNKLYGYKHYYCTALHEEESVDACLNNVTADKMQVYFSAGNPHYNKVITAPQAMKITVP